MKISAEDAFQAMLEGRVRRAPARLTSLGALASALEASERPGPDPRFQRRLRSEILAAAAVTGEELFANSLEGEVDDRVGVLVAVAAALSSTGTETTQPDPRFRFALRNRLVDLASSGSAVRKITARPRRASKRGFRIAVGMGAAATMLFGATFAAAQESLPGDLTYSVKLTQERIGLWTVSGTDEGLRELDYSRRRLGEVRGLTERGERRRPLYTSTLNRMDALTIDATNLIMGAFEANSPRTRAAVERLSSFAVAQASDLNSLLDRLPPEIRPAARDSLGVVENTATRADAALQGCGSCPPDAVIAPTDTAIDDGTTPTPCRACGSQGETSDPESPTNTGGKTSDGSNGGGGQTPPPDDGGVSPPPPVEDDKAVDLPDVPQSDVDERVEDAVDDLLTDLGINPKPSVSVVPVPTITLPPVRIGGLG